MRAALVFFLHLAVAVGLVGVVAQDLVSATGVEICDNGIDDTRGLIDCADPACAGDPACDFEQGCCVLINCDEDAKEGGVAAGFNGTEFTCLDNVAQEPCADHVNPCIGDPQGPQCLTSGLVCAEANLVKGSCAQVPGCAQFTPGFAAPAASYPGLVGLVFLLAGTGFYYVRRHS